MGQVAPFLRRVRVTDYKSIASCEVTFTPLLVLLGPNGVGKSNFVDALRFVADALDSTPADAVAKRGGLDEVLRQVPAATNEFTIHLEFVIEATGKPTPVEYGFTIGRDSSGRRPLVIKREHCVIRHEEGESGSGGTHFEVKAGLVRDRGGIERDRLYLPLAATQDDFSAAYYDLRNMLFHHLDARSHFSGNASRGRRTGCAVPACRDGSARESRSDRGARDGSPPGRRWSAVRRADRGERARPNRGHQRRAPICSTVMTSIRHRHGWWR